MPASDKSTFLLKTTLLDIFIFFDVQISFLSNNLIDR
jgi:hypothetical protein